MQGPNAIQKGEKEKSRETTTAEGRPEKLAKKGLIKKVD